MTRCEHCRLQVTPDPGGTHLEGSNAGLQSCGAESMLPYGYRAHPEGTPCPIHCLGRRAEDGTP